MNGNTGKKGFALVLVLVAVGVAVVLGFSYVRSTTVKLVSSNSLVAATRAKYLAESGLQHAMYVLWTNPAALNGSQANPLGPFNADGSGHSYVFYAVPDAQRTWTYVVVARATCGEVTQESGITVMVVPSYENVILDDEPVGYWRLGEDSGTTATDETGGIDGTYENDVTLGEDGAISNDPDDAGVTFDDISERIKIGPSDALYLTGDMSISMWVKVDSFPVAADTEMIFTLLADGKKEDTVRLAELSVTAGGDLAYRQDYYYGPSDKGEEKHTFQQADLLIDTWYNIVLTRDVSSNQVLLYIDGALVETYSYSRDPAGYPPATLYLGKYGIKGFDGQLDEPAIFDYVLTPQQIVTHNDTASTEALLTILSFDY